MSFVSCFNKIEIQGNILNNHNSIPFKVIDHQGKTIDSSNMNQDIFLMTFVFTECTNVCPIVTSQIKQSLILNNSETETPVILISVDPENDNEISVDNFIEKWELQANWSYITGNKNSLEPIWENYFINPMPTNPIEELTQNLATKNKIIHTSPVYIFNKKGSAKVVHNSPIDPEKLVNDMKILSKE
ncbi:MAG: SCO family protein [Dehalococcoidia bacterium]